jgi:hypothetical protein
LRSVGGAKHGKLPHCPVPSIIVSRWAVVLTVHKSFLQLIRNRNNQVNNQHLKDFQIKICDCNQGQHNNFSWCWKCSVSVIEATSAANKLTIKTQKSFK